MWSGLLRITDISFEQLVIRKKLLTSHLWLAPTEMKPVKKGTKLYSIIHFKCPYCQEGNFFVNNNPYVWKTIGDVKKHCDCCKRPLSVETGFYYGAMYVSYAFGVAIFVAVYLGITILRLQLELHEKVFSVAVFVLLFSPLNYALSKIIWANFFMSYKGDKERVG